MLYLFLPVLALKFMILHSFKIFNLLALILMRELRSNKIRYRQCSFLDPCKLDCLIQLINQVNT